MAEVIELFGKVDKDQNFSMMDNLRRENFILRKTLWEIASLAAEMQIPAAMVLGNMATTALINEDSLDK